MTDKAVLAELGRRLERLRLGNNLTQAELADAAGLSKRTLERIEQGASVQTSNLIRLFRALNRLEALDIVLPDTGPTPMEQLQRRGKARRRARPKSQEGTAVWRWGDGR
ncbi:MAG TPA: helix-turn-helix transcriptional regulator [Caulobacteraceae bacterium]